MWNFTFIIIYFFFHIGTFSASELRFFSFFFSISYTHRYHLWKKGSIHSFFKYKKICSSDNITNWWWWWYCIIEWKWEWEATELPPTSTTKTTLAATATVPVAITATKTIIASNAALNVVNERFYWDTWQGPGWKKNEGTTHTKYCDSPGVFSCHEFDFFSLFTIKKRENILNSTDGRSLLPTRMNTMPFFPFYFVC